MPSTAAEHPGGGPSVAPEPPLAAPPPPLPAPPTLVAPPLPPPPTAPVPASGPSSPSAGAQALSTPSSPNPIATYRARLRSIATPPRPHPSAVFSTACAQSRPRERFASHR